MVVLYSGSESTPKLGGMNPLQEIARIIDHEQFDCDDTLGQQVAQRLAPILDAVWRSGYKTCHDLYMGGTLPAVAMADLQRRAVFEVTDLEDELEAQERRHQ